MTAPVSQRRTRIHVGPGGAVFVLVSGIVLISAFYTQANLLFWAFGLLIGGMIVSIFLTAIALRHVHVQRLVPGHGVADDLMIIRYKITNRSWLPVFSLVICESWSDDRGGWRKRESMREKPLRLRGRPCGWLLHLGAYQTQRAEAPCWPTCRGTIQFEKIELATGFPFNLFIKVVEWPQEDAVLIYPHLYRIKRKLLHTLSQFDPAGRDQLSRSGGTEDFYGLRAYRYGDNLRLIDWKRTARTGTLISREMTQPCPPRLMVLLDLRQYHKVDSPAGRERQQAMQSLPAQAASAERAISLAASFICEAHFQGYQVGLTVLGTACGRFPVNHSLLHRGRMLEALARIELDRPVTREYEPMVRPSVIIRLGAGGENQPSEVGRVFGSDHLEQYVGETVDEGQSILERRAMGGKRRDAGGKR